MVHKARKKGLPFSSKLRQSVKDHLVVAFEDFQQLGNVTIRPMKAISATSDMHEDICSSAENKQAAMVILPYHKEQRLDGTLETIRCDYEDINQRVVEHAPCSVGILVDRGLGGRIHLSGSRFYCTVTVLHFGGKDDNEALAYGARMAEHPGINLRVVHFIMDADAAIDQHAVTIINESILAETVLNNKSIHYEERKIRNVAEIVSIVREYSGCNLFVVGRNPEPLVGLTLSGISNSPELGLVGSLLTSSDFLTASVLVVQQPQHH
ncbi:Cation/H(+) antiporter [Thalictrum thalictroides]|uniref:Cation/H(+) antiporter n=1 Tax=Thalictrum thalictroides TaxID=46969 RepID=A0A7J6W271_THATH|nr:Cation/H(+) antiporter [Thalictrum thalictroides]